MFRMRNYACTVKVFHNYEKEEFRYYVEGSKRHEMGGGSRLNSKGIVAEKKSLSIWTIPIDIVIETGRRGKLRVTFLVTLRNIY